MNRIIPWFRKKLNKLNVFEVPVKEGAVCTNENSRAESLNDIDPAFEVESEEDVFLSCLETQELSSPTSLGINKDQSQEEKPRLSENQKSFPIGLNVSVCGDASLPFDEEKHAQVFSSSPKIRIQEDEKFNGQERALIKSVPVLKNDGKERQHFNSLPNLRADCKDNLFKAHDIQLDEAGQESPPKYQVPDIKHINVQEASVDKSVLSLTSEEDFIPEGVFCHYWIGEVLKPLQTSYIFESCFDSGSFGIVCKLRHRVTQVEIAAKLVESQLVAENEIEIWKTLDHPHILPLIETFQSKEYQVFVSPLMEGNLWRLVDRQEVSFREIQKYLADAMRGLNYLHARNLVHLDIKPDNVLIDANGAKLCDFGFIAYTYTDQLTYGSDLGMPLKYRPPECCISLGSDPLIPYEKGCDLWGFGIMLVELLTCFPLADVKTGGDLHAQVYPVIFKVLQKEEFFKRVKSSFEEVDDVAVEIALDCVHRFLRKSPYKRMDASVALKHPFFGDKNIASFNRMPKDYICGKRQKPQLQN